MKYFVHGIVFTGLYALLVLVWALLFAGLVLAGAFIGLIIGFVILMLIVGALNSLLTDLLWFPVKMAWTSTFGHGFLLFMSLAIMNLILVTAPNQVFPSIATKVITFLIAAFVDGWVAKKVAGIWKYEYKERLPKTVEEGWPFKS